MQRLYHLFLVLILLIVAVLFLSVIHAEDISKTKLLDRIKKRDKIERNILPFNPEYFKKTQAQHIIIFFDVINGRLIASDKKAIIRPGRRPHHPFSGNFVVVCKTSEGEIIDRFFINDPASTRLPRIKTRSLGGCWVYFKSRK